MLHINPKIVGKKPYTIPTDSSKVNLAVIINYVDHVGNIPQHANCYFDDDDKLQLLKKLLNEELSDNILVTAGSGNALKLILDTFVAPNTKIGILTPNYPGFIHDAELSQGEVIKLPYNGDLASLIKDKELNMLYLSNPNLPIGYEFSTDILRQICIDNPSILFVIDEAYLEYTSRESMAPFLLSNVIVVKTLSKAFGLAGMRVGYLIAHNDLLEYLNISYDSKTLTHESINAAIEVMQNKKYYLDKVIEFKTQLLDFQKKLVKYLYSNAEICAAAFTSCPWFMLQCRNPARVCQIFNDNNFLIRDKSSEIEGAVRITFSPKYADDILRIVKSINFGFEKVIFDLDGTMRKTYKSPIESYIVDKWEYLQSKYSARIITNNCSPRETLVQMLSDNGINNADIISPITQEMNPTDADWFNYNDELYILRYPQNFTHAFACAIKSAKIINAVEIEPTTSSAELDMLPDVPMPYIGIILQYARYINPEVFIKVIGKTTLILTDEPQLDNIEPGIVEITDVRGELTPEKCEFNERLCAQRTIMVGDNDVDRDFAIKNKFEFFDVRIDNLENFVECL
jgi:histidinol-phosphate/aromatic aminotransferase/cobyric acid decarboxylase-like protein